jgi:hypothetical protein
MNRQDPMVLNISPMGVGVFLANYESKGLPNGRSPTPWTMMLMYF